MTREAMRHIKNNLSFVEQFNRAYDGPVERIVNLRGDVRYIRRA